MATAEKIGLLSNNKRQSRYSKPYITQKERRKYRHLNVVGRNKKNHKKIPRWAAQKEFLSKFSRIMKERVDPEEILGKFDGSKQGNFSISEVFNYKSKKVIKKTSKYFQSIEKNNQLDPIDARGSSANWENEKFTSAKRFKLPNEFHNGQTDSSRLKMKYGMGEESRNNTQKILFEDKQQEY
jgi:hypothetical protein